MAGHKLTKAGANFIGIVDASVTAGDIDVNEGTLAFARTTVQGTGKVTVNNTGNLQISSGTVAGSITRDIILNGGILSSADAASFVDSAIQLTATSTVATAGDLTVNGGITETSGPRTLTKTGGSTLILAGASSTRTGETIIDNGVIRVDADNALGSGKITIGDTTLGATSHSLRLNAVTIGNDVDSKYTYTGDYTGAITAIGGSKSTISGNVTMQSILSGSSFRGGDLATVGAGSVLLLAGELNVGGSRTGISQRGGVVEYGGGASTSYSLTISDTARLAANNGIGSGVTIALGGSGNATLDLNGFSTSVEAVTRYANTTYIENNGAADSTLTVSQTQDRVFSGVIRDNSGATSHTVALEKKGSFTYSLTGFNSYSGPTTVYGGTLAGTGSMESSVTVKNGGTLAPGADIGSFNCTTAAFESGSSFAVELDSSDASVDNLNATGNVSIAVGTTLTTRNIAATPAALTLGTELVLINYSGYALTGTFDGLAEGAEITAGPNKFVISYTNSSRVTLTANGSAGGFANWAATNGPGQTIDQDHDGDGVPNGIEYFMGQSGSGFTATPGIVGGKVSWPKGSSYTGAYGTDYGVQTSSDLSHWTDATVGAGPGFVTDGNPVEFTMPTAAPKTFVRLKVTGP